MSKRQASHLANLIATKCSDGSIVTNSKYSATSTRITAVYNEDSTMMQIYSNYTRDNVLDEFEYLKKFEWIKA